MAANASRLFPIVPLGGSKAGIAEANALHNSANGMNLKTRF
jgi:hypothetical protein